MVIENNNIQQIRARFEKLAWAFDERMRRLFAAAEAAVLGHGGVTMVAEAIVACVIPKTVGIVIEVGALGGFILLAIYITATASSFHKAHCVFCVHCGSSLLTLGEELEYLAEDGIERPDTLECPKCHQVVVTKSA